MSKVLKGPKVSAPGPVNVNKSISDYVSGYSKALPNVIAAEQKYRPEFLGLNLKDVNTFLQGTDGQMGIFGLSAMARQQTSDELAAAREQEFQSMLGNAPAFRQFAQTLSPEAQQQVEASQYEAARASQSARGLTPQENRMAQQGAREAFASRGMLNSNASVVGEALGREDILAQKRAEAAGARGNAFNMAQQFYTAPGLQALGNTPLAYQLAQQQIGMGLGAIGSAKPQMINPDVGVNMAQQQQAMQAQAGMANQSASAQRMGGLMQGIGSMAGGLFAMSDRRLKENIRRVGQTDGGLPVYIYNYKGNPQTHMGVMAQDVEKVNPEAVTEVDGYKAVYYNLIH